MADEGRTALIVEREVRVEAPPDVVFAFCARTDQDAWAARVL